jgi:hypothetical protein
MEDLIDMQQEYLRMENEDAKKQLEENANIISSFKKFCSGKGIKLTDENFDYIKTTGIVANYPNIVDLLCPEIHVDKEGLFHLSELRSKYKIRMGFIHPNDFIVMPHPYFRRNFNSYANFAPNFIGIFLSDTSNNIEQSIALDRDRVRIDINGGIYMERDQWFGANFDKQISSIPDGIIKLRSPTDINKYQSESLFKSVYSLDIKWKEKDNIKTFQSEEFKTEDITILHKGKTVYPVRYVHAEFDLEKNKFRHLDGAIHYYTPDEYYSRLDSDFNYNSKNNNQIKTQSEKLFKLNGIFDVDIWAKYISHFMTGNPLVFEYLEGDYPEDIKNRLSRIRKNDRKE